MKTLILLFFAIGLMSFSGCERENESVIPPDATKLIGDWKLIEPASTYNVTLTFATDSASNFPFTLRLSGESSVNYYFGEFQYNAGGLADPRSQVVIDNIGSTKRGGPAEALQFEQTYYNNLKAVNRYELTTDDRLRLYYGGERSGVLVYQRAK